MNYEYVVYLYDKQGYTIDIVYIADRAHAIKYAKNRSRYDRKTVIIDDFANEIIATYRNGKKEVILNDCAEIDRIIETQGAKSKQ